MAFIVDPQGATFRLWEPRAHIGAEIVREPGAVAWFELASPDPAAVAPFYSDLFDWTIAGAQGMEEYLIATTADGEGTGAIQAANGQPGGWIVYFWAGDVDATLATAKEHGAGEVVPATDIPGGMGRFAIVRDPQGAIFGLFTG
jgi:predicted enzyme related to lactoylglutathione lyase